MTTRSELQALLTDPNVRAWLHVIAAGESFEDMRPEAFSLMNGGGHFASFADHPYAGQSAPPGLASGFAQFIPHTWGRLVDAYGFPDFTPQCQLEGAVALTIGRGAIDDVKAGNVAEALRKCLKEWTSFQTMQTARAERIFVRYAGVLPIPGDITLPQSSAPPVPENTAANQVSNVGGNPMGAALALLPMLIQFIPQIAALIKPGSASTARDAALAQTVLNTVAQAAGVMPATIGGPGQHPPDATATDVGAAIDAMTRDPALVKQVTKAVVTQPEIMQVLEIGGGIKAAREANLALQTSDSRWWLSFASPVFVFGLLLCGFIFMVLGNMLGMPWGGTFDKWAIEIRAAIISSIVTGSLAAIFGYWFGTTVSSSKKDSVIADQARQAAQ